MRDIIPISKNKWLVELLPMLIEKNFYYDIIHKDKRIAKFNTYEEAVYFADKFEV